jgi:hypothetical protein
VCDNFAAPVPRSKCGLAPRAMAWVALILVAGCGSHSAAPSCLVNEDCQPDQFCDATETSVSSTCYQTQPGTCRNVNYSDNQPCTQDSQCSAAGLVCSVPLGQCALNVCVSVDSNFAQVIYCDSRGCPDAGANAVLVQCGGTSCRAGTRRDKCYGCFCLSCTVDAGSGPDGSGG